MDVLVDPPLLASLGPKPLRVLLHTGVGEGEGEGVSETETLTIPLVYPSETVFHIKQRIAVAKGSTKEWMPAYQFVAVKDSDSDNYKPADVKWPLALSTVPDPFSPDALGLPNPHLYADGERKVGNPVRMPSLLLHDVFSEEDDRTLHVWTLRTLHAAIPPEESSKPSVFVGFYQLYFPSLKSRDDLEHALAPPTAADTQALSSLQTFVESQQTQLGVLESALSALPPSKTPLHELRQLVFELPRESVRTSLELLFYNTDASPALPFLRYFPVQARVTPLIKYSSATISDARVFESLMAEQPGFAEAVLLLKCPIKHVRAPFGTAWTMRITQSRVEVSIGAPRRDTPLKADVVRYAYAELGPFLAATPFGSATPALTHLTAVYALRSPLADKPVKRDFVKRLTPFLTLFHNDAMLHGDKATLSLRYKAVSNYRKETDPKLAYLTTLFLRDATVSEGTIPVASYISSLSSEFGLGTKEAADLVSVWLAQEAKGVSDVKEGSDLERERFIKLHPMGVHVSLYNNHPAYLVSIAGCETVVDLQRILSLTSALVSLPTERFATAATAAAAAAATAASAAEETVEEAPPLSAAAAPEGAPAVWDMMNFGGDDAGEEETEEPLENAIVGSASAAAAPAPAPAPAAAALLPTRLAEGETIPPSTTNGTWTRFEVPTLRSLITQTSPATHAFNSTAADANSTSPNSRIF